ncbi:MAG: YeeE/YedE thiosulfate transporter family protein [Methanoregulaceae archaeon]
MFGFLGEATWSPYIAGAGIGILVCISLLLANRPIGCSSAFVKAWGLLGRLVSRKKVEAKEYYRMVVPAVDWFVMIIPGIIAGAFVSSVLSGTFRVVVVPAAWGAVFGYNPVIRIAVALLGGILLGIGARWAGGCTSGHGISGSIQLSLASMITACCFFAGGIAVAMFLFYGVG